jgi:ATP-dependent helicase/nuclease subunit B
MTLFSLPPGAAPLPSLAALWAAHCARLGSDRHDGLILLPTRRAARGLAAAFLAMAGRASLLPRIVPLGALDEAPLALAGALDLPPAIEEPHRLAVLARLILHLRGAGGAPTRPDTAWLLARDLAALMDEAERAEIDLHQGLLRAAEGAHAAHWDQTLNFLRIVTHHWPDYLAERGLMNPAARQVALIEAQIAAWQAAPPKTPVLAVAAAADIPAIGRLLRAVAALPSGLVVLPGLDLGLSAAEWEALDEAHPHYGTRALLAAIGARREEVRETDQEPPGWAAPRAAMLRRALLPAPVLDWGKGSSGAPPVGPEPGIARLAPCDPQEEAVAVAMILRDALGVPGVRAALITPDRGLAERVAAELSRWGVVADDSAGEKLCDTPPAVFLRLIAAAIDAELSPVPLLAVLKHPLCGAGLPAPDLRRRARRLELACLRGPAPLPGLAGLRRAVGRASRRCGDDAAPDAMLGDLLERLERCLEPLLRAVAQVAVTPADLLTALVAAAEALAATDDTGGPARLWGGEEGEALARLLAEVQEALPALPETRPDCLPGLLDAVLRGATVRSRRATRGRGGQEHPRVFIWGLLEARLQSVDVAVLGGLTEGVWPSATDPGPWMSRPMRARAGLASPELRVGQAAHDFWTAALSAPAVVVSAPRRRDGAPTVASRWLTRLAAMLGEPGLPIHPAQSWAGQLDLPAAGPVPVAAPCPRPAVENRPRRLNVTEIGTLMTDPYAVHARRVLSLSELAPLEQSADFKDYGTIVHDGLHHFLKTVGTDWPDGAAATLFAALERALRDAGVRPALITWWTPRLHLIAAWVDAEERRRRAALPVLALATEHRGEWVLPGPAGPFSLVGRADRIELRADGRITIIDYKTGSLPTKDDVGHGRAPQMLLEGAMVRHGAFGAAWQGEVGELTYWRLSGDHKAGESRPAQPGSDNAIENLIDDAEAALVALVALFDDPETAYRATAPDGPMHPYAQLARAAEWGSAGDGQ